MINDESDLITVTSLSNTCFSDEVEDNVLSNGQSLSNISLLLTDTKDQVFNTKL